MEIVIKRANAAAAIEALERAFPGKPWSALLKGAVTVEGRSAAARIVATLSKWDETTHPRAQAGTSTGGQFVAAGAGTPGGGVSMKAGLQTIHNAVKASNGKLHATLKVTTHDNKNHYFKAPTAAGAHEKFYLNGPTNGVKSLTFGTSHAPLKAHMGSPVLGFKAYGGLAHEGDLDKAPEEVKPSDEGGEPLHEKLGSPAPSPDASYPTTQAVKDALENLHANSHGKAFPAIKLVYHDKNKYVMGHSAHNAVTLAEVHHALHNKPSLIAAKIGLIPSNLKSPTQANLAANFLDYGHVAEPNKTLAGEPKKTLSPYPVDHIEESKPITDNQEIALNNYKASAYRPINKLLAGRLDAAYRGGTAEKQIRAYVTQLDEALDTHHTNKDLDLFRGAKWDHLPENFKVGTTFSAPAFSSASLSDNKAYMFNRGLMFHVHVPKGTRALPGVTSEKELILPRNGQFTITKMNSPHFPSDVWVDFKDTNDKTWYHSTEPPLKEVEVAKAGDQSDRFTWTQDELERMLDDTKRAQLQKRIEQARAALAKWEENDHPRAAAGSSTGGQFVSGGGVGSGSTGSASAPVGGKDHTGPTGGGAFHISDKDKADITNMMERGASPEEISKHPAITAAKEHAQALPETHNQPGYDTPAWRAGREFNGGVRGYKAATDALITKALSYSKHGPVRHDKQATILMGPPASGKSYFGEQIAAKHHAAIVDPDDAKKMFKEYRGGIGANAVHEESGVLAGAVQARLMASGTNMVFPKVGKSRESIENVTKTLKTLGYRVNLVNVDVHQDEAFKRSTKRFLNTGRMISHDYTRSVDGNPTKTYHAIKDSGDYAQTVNIDANGRPGRHRITEGAHTSIGRSLLPK